MKRWIRFLPWLVALAVLIALAPVIRSTIVQREYGLAWQRFNSRLTTPQYAFIGDSLTAWNNWGWDLARNPFAAVNLAEAGAPIALITTQAAAVGAYHAPVLFVTAGTNDVVGYRRSASRIREDYAELLRRCPQDATLVVTLIPYTADRALNAKIDEANVYVRELAERRGARIINLNPHLAPEGVLSPEFSTDGLHFNDKGYDIWVREIRRALEA